MLMRWQPVQVTHIVSHYDVQYRKQWLWISKMEITYIGIWCLSLLLLLITLSVVSTDSLSETLNNTWFQHSLLNILSPLSAQLYQCISPSEYQSTHIFSCQHPGIVTLCNIVSLYRFSAIIIILSLLSATLAAHTDCHLLQLQILQNSEGSMNSVYGSPKWRSFLGLKYLHLLLLLFACSVLKVGENLWIVPAVSSISNTLTFLVLVTPVY